MAGALIPEYPVNFNFNPIPVPCYLHMPDQVLLGHKPLALPHTADIDRNRAFPQKFKKLFQLGSPQGQLPDFGIGIPIRIAAVGILHIMVCIFPYPP